MVQLDNLDCFHMCPLETIMSMAELMVRKSHTSFHWETQNFDPSYPRNHWCNIVILTSSENVIILVNHPKSHCYTLHRFGWAEGWSITTLWLRRNIFVTNYLEFTRSPNGATQKRVRVFSRRPKDMPFLGGPVDNISNLRAWGMQKPSKF